MALIALQAAAGVLAALLALAAVMTRDPLRQLAPFLLYNLALIILFITLQAPDVALSGIAVGLAYPFIMLFAIGKARDRER
jgi:energy-converting hydrogenase B subunit D